MIAARRLAAPPLEVGASQDTPRCVVRLVPLDPGLYRFDLDAAAWQEPGSVLALPCVQICRPPDAEATIAISDALGRGGTWLGGRCRTLFVSVPAGGTALVTAYLADGPVELEIGRVDAAPSPPAQKVRLTLAAPEMAPPLSPRVDLEVVAHIRGRGDVRFVRQPWIGRLGGGFWIEALTLAPHDRLAAAAIEYKGLIAGGAETPWTACGAPCGTQGRGLPLIGIAVRQKSGSGDAAFDCEYTGCFQSGATAGPARNGAPCRSTIDGDPLEGLQLSITRRPAPVRQAGR